MTSVNDGNNSDSDGGIRMKPFWPITSKYFQPKYNPLIPQCSNEDIGRRIIRGESISFSSSYSGWDSIGVVIQFHKMIEVRIDGSSSMNGEIGSNIKDLHSIGNGDIWKVIYGNGDIETLRTTDFIRGLNLYDTILKSSDLQKQMHLTKIMLNSSSCPPNFLADDISLHSYSRSHSIDSAQHPIDAVEHSTDTVQRSIDELLPKKKGRSRKYIESTSSLSFKKENEKKSNEQIQEENNFDKSNISVSNSKKSLKMVFHNDDDDDDSIQYFTEVNKPIILDEDRLKNEDNENILDFDILCSICGSGQDAPSLLLCDMCDSGYHMKCLDPPLTEIPQGSWYCNTCNRMANTTFQCKLCSKAFKSLGGYKYHMSKNICIKTGIVIDSIENDETSQKKIRKRKRESFNSVPYEWAAEDGYLTYKCNQCEKVFKTKPGIKYHMENVCISDEERVRREEIAALYDTKSDKDNEDDNGNDDDDLASPKKRQRKTIVDLNKVFNEKDSYNNDQDDDDDDDDDEFSTKDIDDDNEVSSSSLDDDNSEEEDNDDNDRYDTTRTINRKNPLVRQRSSLVDMDININKDSNKHIIQSIQRTLSQEKRFETFQEIKMPIFRNSFHLVPEYPIADSIEQSAMIDTNIIDVISLATWIDKLNMNSISNQVEMKTHRNLKVPNVILTMIDKSASNESMDIFPFEAVRNISSSSSNNDNFNWILNCGGPVWSMAFNYKYYDNPYHSVSGDPIISKSSESAINSIINSNSHHNNHTRYLAIGLSRIGWERKGDSNIFSVSSNDNDHESEYDIGIDSCHFVNKPSTNPTILEIWTIQSNPEKSDKKSMILSYCVGYEWRGPIWQIAWSPVEFHDPNTAGMLAVCCGDGSCLVFMVPSEFLIRKSDHDDSKSNQARCNNHNIGYHIPLIEGDKIVKWELRIKDCFIMCCSWNTFNPWQIACGLSDGTIAIFQLNSQSLINREIRNPLPVSRLIDSFTNTFIFSISAIRSIEYCPFDKDLIITSDQETNIKIWNVNIKYKPIYIKNIHTVGSWLHDAHWDAQGKGYYYAGSDNSLISWDSMWTPTIKRGRTNLYEHNYRYSGVWKILSILSDSAPNNESTLISSVGSDGSIRCGLTSNLIKEKRRDNHIYQIFRILNIAEADHVNSKLDSNSGDGSHHEKKKSYKNSCRISNSKNSEIPTMDADKTNYQRVVMEIETNRFCPIKEGISNQIPPPNFAMHTIATCRFRFNSSNTSTTSTSTATTTSSKEKSSERRLSRLISFGGSMGLVQIHSIDGLHHDILLHAHGKRK